MSVLVPQRQRRVSFSPGGPRASFHPSPTILAAAADKFEPTTTSARRLAILPTPTTQSIPHNHCPENRGRLRFPFSSWFRLSAPSHPLWGGVAQEIWGTSHRHRLYVGLVAADVDLEALGLLDGLEGEARRERAELIAWLLDRGFSIDQIRASVAPLLLPANRVMGSGIAGSPRRWGCRRRRYGAGCAGRRVGWRRCGRGSSAWR